jgi:hypothetical protein
MASRFLKSKKATTVNKVQDFSLKIDQHGHEKYIIYSDFKNEKMHPKSFGQKTFSEKGP